MMIYRASFGSPFFFDPCNEVGCWLHRSTCVPAGVVCRRPRWQFENPEIHRVSLSGEDLGTKYP